MNERWAAIDQGARTAKRAAFAETKRGAKRLRERVRNLGTTGANLTGRAWRRFAWTVNRLRKQGHELGEARKRLATYRAEWAIERQLARLAAGSGPIVVGPWLSEVGYEVLYWVPFVRWVQAQYSIHPSRFVVVTRGGAAVWYGDMGQRAVELFDLMTPAEFAARNAQRSAEDRGTLKQFDISAMDREILAQVHERLGLQESEWLHPSLLYRLFHQFWLGHRPPSFLERRTRYRRLTVPAMDLPPLPASYVAVKFYGAQSLPPTEPVRRMVQSIVRRLAERTDVVLLDTGLAFDDHEDFVVGAANRVHVVRDALEPRTNLAVQTAIIAGATAYVGTCGALAWLAPMLGVNTTAIFTDARFLHGHLGVARRVYQEMDGAGTFSPLDVSALDALGLVDGLAGPVNVGHGRMSS